MWCSTDLRKQTTKKGDTNKKGNDLWDQIIRGTLSLCYVYQIKYYECVTVCHNDKSILTVFISSRRIE